MSGNSSRLAALLVTTLIVVGAGTAVIGGLVTATGGHHFVDAVHVRSGAK